MADLEQAERELGEAIAGVLHRHGLMVNRWLMVAEVIDNDGGRMLTNFTSQDLRAWDSLGMLHYQAGWEQAALVTRFADGSDQAD